MTSMVRGGTALGGSGRAPESNDAGVLSAVRQIKDGALNREDAQPRYDRTSDTLYVRFRSSTHRPSVSYFLPNCPQIILRLDMETGLLTGIDLTEFRKVLAKRDPAFAKMYRQIVVRRIRHALRRPAQPKPPLAREAADGILSHCQAA